MEKSKVSGVESAENGKRVLLDNNNVVKLESQDNPGIPIDRGWAWMAVLGCFGVHVFACGGVKSLGVLIVEIWDRFQDVSAKQLGLVQGINLTLMMGLSLASNLLAARFTTRAVVFLGGLLACLGFVMTALVDTFWLVYITYSVTAGLGFAFVYTPSIVFVGNHFRKRRSLANGLSLAGSGIGSLILPNIMRLMLKEYGLPGCCMIMGALMLHMCVCGLLFRPYHNYRNKSPRVETEVLATEVTNTSCGFLVNGSTDQVIVDPLLDDTQGKESEKERKVDAYIKLKLDTENIYKTELYIKDLNMVNGYSSKEEDVSEANNANTQTLLESSVDGSQGQTFFGSSGAVNGIHLQNGFSEASPSTSKQSLFSWSLLSDPVFFLYIIFTLFVGVAYPNIFFMLPAHAENEGVDRDSAALLLSFIGITDLLGRPFIGWFTDLKLFDRRYALVACAFMSGVLSISMPALKTFGAMAFYSVAYGFCAGCYVTLIPVVLSDVLGPEKLTSSFGIVNISLSASVIPAPIACGQIRDSTGSWKYAFVFVGLFAVFGSLFPLLQPCVQRRSAHAKLVKEHVVSNGDTKCEV